MELYEVIDILKENKRLQLMNSEFMVELLTTVEKDSIEYSTTLAVISRGRLRAQAINTVLNTVSKKERENGMDAENEVSKALESVGVKRLITKETLPLDRAIKILERWVDDTKGKIYKSDETISEFNKERESALIFIIEYINKRKHLRLL